MSESKPVMRESKPVVIYDGVHNGYGYERLFLQTPHGTLTVGRDGDVTVSTNAPSLVQDDKAQEVLTQMVTEGIDKDGRALELYEEETTFETLSKITAILAWAGLPAPYILNIDDGTLKHRWTAPPSKNDDAPRKRLHGDADDFDPEEWIRIHGNAASTKDGD